MYPVHEHTLCRLCLCSGGRLMDIFKENNGVEFVVDKTIEDLLKVKVVKEVGFPWLVCATCLAKLTEFRLFKRRCLECQIVFENRVKRMKFPSTSCWAKSHHQRVLVKKGKRSVERKPPDNKKLVAREEAVAVMEQDVNGQNGLTDRDWESCSHGTETVETSYLTCSDGMEVSENKLSTASGMDSIVEVEDSTSPQVKTEDISEDVVQEGSEATAEETVSSAAAHNADDGSTLRKLLLTGWCRFAGDGSGDLSPNYSSNEVILSDNGIGIDDEGSKTREGSMKVEEEGEDDETLRVEAANRAEIGQECGVDGDGAAGGMLRRLLINDWHSGGGGGGDVTGSVPFYVSGVDGSENSRSISATSPHKSPIATRVHREMSSEPGDGENEVGNGARGISVKSSSEKGQSQSEAVSSRLLELKKTQAKQMNRNDGVQGEEGEDGCVEVYFRKGILKSLLLDHTWTVKSKDKMRNSFQQDYSARPGGSERQHEQGLSGDKGETNKELHNPACSKETENVEDGAGESGLASPCKRSATGKLLNGPSREDGKSVGSLGLQKSVGVLRTYGMSKNKKPRTESDNVMGKSSDASLVQPKSAVGGDLETLHDSTQVSPLRGESGTGPKDFAGSESGYRSITKLPENAKPSPFPCYVCSELFGDKALLRNHIRTEHIGKVFSCKVCLKKLSCLGDLKEHLQMHDGLWKQSLCEVCGQTFTTNTYPKTHVSSHPSGRPSKGREHGKGFLSESVPKENGNFLSDPSTRRCDACLNVYQKNPCRSHEESFSCDKCRVVFACKSTLREHLRGNCS